MDPEIILRPVKLVYDPFRQNPNRIVLCECLKLDGTPIASNKRPELLHSLGEDCLRLAFAQDVTILAKDKRTLMDEIHDVDSSLAKTSKVSIFADACMQAILHAGIPLAGLEVRDNTSFTIRTASMQAADAADSLWLVRYIMCRVGEMFDIHCSFQPVAHDGAKAAGCAIEIWDEKLLSSHSAAMTVCENMRARHMDHLAVYGVDNEDRYVRDRSLPPIDACVLKVGGAITGCSLWIPDEKHWSERPMIVDIRPAANVEPYMAGGKIICSLYQRGMSEQTRAKTEITSTPSDPSITSTERVIDAEEADKLMEMSPPHQSLLI